MGYYRRNRFVVLDTIIIMKVIKYFQSVMQIFDVFFMLRSTYTGGSLNFLDYFSQLPQEDWLTI